ncbi:MAG: hypothetical protein M1433_00480 [Candidatus Parvarchaeota archaeon]|nr:hypothetical protein [Candidatus Parvarchaeota archaeon]
MEMNAFEAINELKKFFDGTGSIMKLSTIIPAKKLDINLDYLEGAVKLKVSHPLRLYADEIYKILLRLYLVSSTELIVDFISGGKPRSVSKKFGADENIKDTINDLLELPHERITDIIIETEYFKIVETSDLNDTVSMIIKKGDQKALFRSLLNYLFPFVNVSVDKSAKEEITFEQNEDELTADVSITVDGTSIGIKSKHVKLLKI